MSQNYSNSVIDRNHRRVIGTFPTRKAAEQALHELRDSGFPMDRVSVVAQDVDRNDTIAGTGVRDQADNKADDGAKVGALSGGALGGLTGLLVGIGALAIPGIGPIMLAGAAATALATTAAGGAIGAAAGSLAGGLVGMGIPEERARVYNERVSAGEYLVMVDGTDAEIAQATAILNRHGVEELGSYDIPAASTPVATVPAVGGAALDQSTGTLDSALPARPVTSSGSAPVSTPMAPAVATDEEAVRLYEERLVVDKDREKTGEVAFGKHVEVETVQTSVPIERESVVIERIPGDATAVTSGADAFHDDAIRVEVYEEVPDIQKEAFVREEVKIRKEVTRENVNVEETLRREELDINTQDQLVIEDHSDQTGKTRP